MITNEPILTQVEAASLAEDIMTTATGETGGCTIEEICGLVGRRVPTVVDYPDAECDFPEDTPFLDPESGDPVPPLGLRAFYIGYTARSIWSEYLRWLTERGASPQADDGTFIDPTARNRPVYYYGPMARVVNVI